MKHPGVFREHHLLRVGVVPSESLDRSRRIASLSALGRQLTQQRVIHHFTRLAVPLRDLAMQTWTVERELELQASWSDRACERDGRSLTWRGQKYAGTDPIDGTDPTGTCDGVFLTAPGRER